MKAESVRGISRSHALHLILEDLELSDLVAYNSSESDSRRFCSYRLIRDFYDLELFSDR